MLYTQRVVYIPGLILKIFEWMQSVEPFIFNQLKADHLLFDWLINCVILNHF